MIENPIPWIEMGPQVPFVDPVIGPERVEFAFHKKIKDYWDAVGGNKCQTHIYNERQGWYTCGSIQFIETDHTIEESVALALGLDPNNDVVGLPRCRNHHQGPGLVYENGIARLAHYGEPQWSKHPDMYQARMAYRAGDLEAFKKCGHEHHRRALAGEPVSNISPEVTQFEIEWMLHLEQVYSRATGLQRPSVKPHPRFDSSRRVFSV